MNFITKTIVNNTKNVSPIFVRSKINKIKCFIQTKISNNEYSTKPVNPRQMELMARSLPKKSSLPGVKHVIVVASGKGGVGKSTTSTNLAVTLAQMGQRVGLLDADIFGPSIPLMMNISETPLVNDNNLMIPPINYGVKCLSMGLLIDANKPIIWRGPLVMSALQRLLKGAIWDPLDILIVDTPPGTGDIHLSLAQNIPITGALLVSTPQTAALEVTHRGAEMYRTMKIPLIGLIENMNHIKCSNCGHKNEIFKNTTENLAKTLGINVLGSLPINPEVSSGCDAGRPLVLTEPNGEYTKMFYELGEKVLKFINVNNREEINK